MRCEGEQGLGRLRVGVRVGVGVKGDSLSGEGWRGWAQGWGEGEGEG